MIDPTTPETSPEPPAKPRKRWRRLLAALLVLILLAAGGVAGVFFYKRAADAAAERAEAEKQRKLRRALGGDGAAGEDGSPPEQKQALELALPEDAEVKRVVELQPFIVNLSDPDAPRYLRMTVGLGLTGETEESTPDPIFVTRIRNAMLAVMTTKSSNELLTTEGKTALRKQLLQAAQAASEEPHVEAIYITDFIIQL
jgi:flagellar protein FliL